MNLLVWFDACFKLTKENFVFNQQQVNTKAPSEDLNLIKPKSSADCADESQVWNLRFDKVSFQKLVEVFEEFARVVGDTFLFIFFHADIGVYEMFDLVNNAVVLHVQVLFKL